MTTDLFCKLYDTWKQDGAIIYENSHAYSILSITPVTPGHAIIVSKVHVERIDELHGVSLEGFVGAIAGTALSVQALYDRNPESIVHFYRGLKETPPTPTAGEAARKMLEHRHLCVKPGAAYNVGMNVGEGAGQSVNHLHAQLFPRREKGLGIATAMQELLKE